MKSIGNKELIFAITLGLVVGGIFSFPLIYTFTRFSTPEQTIKTTSPLLEDSMSTCKDSILFLPKEVENFISIPFILSEKRKGEQKQGTYKESPVRVSFYTGLARENGGYAKMNALGGYLRVGSLAAPQDIPFGTTFIINDLPPVARTNCFIVDDRGSAIHWMKDGTMKLDIYIKREPDESDLSYFKRVNDLGIIYTKAKYKVD